MKLLLKFFRLPRVKKRLLIRVAFLLILTRSGLSGFSLRTVQRWLAARTQASSTDRPEFDGHQLVAWAVRVVGRRILGDKPCLTQALVAQYLLARQGRASTLCIGVKKNEQGRLCAHAWLDYEGQIVIGGRTSPASYTQLQALATRVPASEPVM